MEFKAILFFNIGQKVSVFSLCFVQSFPSSQENSYLIWAGGSMWKVDCRRKTVTGMVDRLQSLLTRPERIIFIHVTRRESNNLFSLLSCKKTIIFQNLLCNPRLIRSNTPYCGYQMTGSSRFTLLWIALQGRQCSHGTLFTIIFITRVMCSNTEITIFVEKL